MGWAKHGKYQTKIYKVWAHMKSRCNNKNVPNYNHYGGRGISVYNEWNDNFESFYEYVSNLPGYDYDKLGKTHDGISLDRINNDGNYEPGNVRWASRHTQMANRTYVWGKSMFRGVTKRTYKHGFQAYVSVHGKRKHIGISDTEIGCVDLRNNYIIENRLWEYPIQAIPDYLIN